MQTRRDFLKIAVAGGAALALPRPALAFADAFAPPDPFQVPLRVPRVLEPVRSTDERDYFVTTMREARPRLLPNKRTPIWGFDGAFPGPTIKVTRGRPAVVRRINRLDVPVTIHLHGGRVPASSDGHPLDLIRPGGHKDYFYPNDQEATTLWYHDHTHHRSSRNVYKGLAGLYVIEDPAEDEYNLPSGDYDVPLVLQDRKFRRNGSFKFKDSHDDVLGSVFLVNGRPAPFFEVANRRYRFRILNASNSRGYELALSTGEPLVQIASDQGLLSAPAPAATIPLWTGERAEVVIDFSKYPVGTRVVLGDRQDPADPASAAPLVAFDVVREETDDSSLPPMFRPIPRLLTGSVQRELALEFDFDRNVWTINGKTFDPDRIDVKPRLGDTEVWTFRNLSSVRHPMHVHLVRFQVLDRNNLPPSPGEMGWKDTVRVGPSEVVRVAMTFEGHTGRYMFHCHNLAHEDHSMMGQMKVLPAG
ncbi:MAG TPA: multicopper oxidase family protein [Actinomycetota bacterium]|nr:multicopper oxidase family protein [Actinomycetota bacterium]